MAVNLSAFLAYFVTMSAVWQCSVDAISLAPVSWNMSNPMFKTSKNDHVIEVKLYDEIDFLCPHHPLSSAADDNTDQHQLEYYVVYMVSRAEYRDCNIYDDTRAVMMLNCSNPRHRKRFTILFEPFQSIPNAPEYHAGHTYYFITTSTGSRHGLGNLYQGACVHRNMKLTIRVCCDSTTTKTVKTLTSNTVAEDDKVIVQRPTQFDWRVTESQLAPPGERVNNRNGGVISPVTSPVYVVRTRTPNHHHRTRTAPPPVVVKPLDKHDPRAPSDDDVNSIVKPVEDMSSAKHAGLVNSSPSSAHMTSCAIIIVTTLTVLLGLAR